MSGPLPLTKKQEEVWRFIASCDRSPTYFEIRDGLGYRGIAGIQRVLERLEQLGFIRRGPKYGRRRIELARTPDGEIAKFRCLSDWTDDQLRAELARREHSRLSKGGRVNWMTNAKQGSAQLLKSLEAAGVRP